MKIIRVLLEKKLENDHIFQLNARREFAYSEHICAYLHSLFFLGLNDPLIREKKILWNKFVSAKKENKIVHYRQLLKFKPKEDEIILKALSKIEQLKEEGSEFGALYKPFTWAILSFEHQQNE